MKHSIKLSFCVLALTVAVGCGKGSSGSGSSASTSSGSSNLSVTSQAVSDLNSWYASTSEGNYPLNVYGQQYLGSLTETRSVYPVSSSSSSNCSTKTFLGFINFSYCSSGTSSTPTALSTSTRSLYLVSSQNKANNSKLAQAFSVPSGMYQGNITASGTVYTVEFYRTDGSYIRYTINTQYNSQVNPMKIEDSQAGTVEVVTKLQ